MQTYSTKYFGEITVDKDDDEILIETKTDITGKEHEISITIQDIKRRYKRIKTCIKVLDNYIKVYAAGKYLIEKEYNKGNGMKEFFQGIFGKYDEALLEEALGAKSIEELNIQNFLQNIEPPSISIELKNRKVKIFLLYSVNEKMQEIMVMEVDKKLRMKQASYYEI